MMLCLVFILFSIFQLKECREDFKVRYVNMSEGSRSMSIIGSQIGNELSFKLIPGFVELNAVSNAMLLEQVNSTGWGHLYVKSSTQYFDELQAYYSGVIESYISRELIAAHWSNTYEGYCPKHITFCKELAIYLKQNFLSLVDKSRNKDGFWKMIRLQLWQIKGIQDGFDGTWKSNASDITEKYLLRLQDQLFGLYLLQADGDLSALSEILGGSEYHHKYTGKDSITSGRCSAFIKYIKGSIFSSHVTWNTYNTMLRMTKLYDFPYRVNHNEKSSPIVAGRKLSFSSYPGMIASLDDFYITSGGLIAIETTIGNNNASLWKPLRTKAKDIVLEFARVQAANRLATSGDQWSKEFSKFNSGTYNNQWMIVNNNVMKNHRYGQRIPDGALFVAEQIPSLVEYKDVTDHLRTSTYWCSYNIPFFKTIWKTGAFQLNVDKYGDFFDYNKSPRALIFKRNASSVVDELSLMRLMRYNNFKKDPLAKCACTPPYSGENGISARCELNPKNGTYPFGALGYRLHGGTDMKFTTSEMSPFMRFVGISGPTYDQQPVFDWGLIGDSTIKHNMQPKQFKFPPVLTPFQ